MESKPLTEKEIDKILADARTEGIKTALSIMRTSKSDAMRLAENRRQPAAK